jgi:UPF0755 protein
VSKPGSVLDWEADPWDDPVVLEEYEVVAAPRRGRLGSILLFGGLLVVVAALLAAGLTGRWVLNQVAPPGEPGASVNFTVGQGETIESISERLQAEGIITNARMFRWYVENKGGLELQPGYYTLRPMDDMGNILGTLRTPPAQTYTKVTFPEGFTVARMGARIEENIPRITADSFVEVATNGSVRSALAPEATDLEGLLFPDTYQIAGNDTPTQIAQRLVRQMERVAARVGLDKAQEKVGLTPYQVLIIASMIEREAKVTEDRALISRVIYNRLFYNMPLQIDATLFYKTDDSLSFDELSELDQPYNTYMYPGLPPTPIANPGRASIEAALNPAPNPEASDPLCQGIGNNPCAYLYYVLKDAEGAHAFAVTLDQHEANVDRAREAGLLG